MGYFFAKKRRFGAWAILGLFLAVIIWFLGFKAPDSQFNFPDSEKRVAVIINGLKFEPIKTKADTIGNLLVEQNINLSERDKIWPFKERVVYSGDVININLARKIYFIDRDEEIEGYVLGLTVKDALHENNISIGESDLVSPDFSALAHEQEKIEIIRVEIREEKDIEKIDFKKVSKEDGKLGWREKKVSQKGELGKKELTYKAVYHNDKLISRKLLGEKVLEEPTEEISVQGTFMKLGKGKNGQASHYAASWGNLNASRDIPRGSYAKVTNLENGKSVVVKINDYGPISRERIIDLNHASFVELANDWQGIIPRVKVEQVLN